MYMGMFLSSLFFFVLQDFSLLHSIHLCAVCGVINSCDLSLSQRAKLSSVFPSKRHGRLRLASVNEDPAVLSAFFFFFFFFLIYLGVPGIFLRVVAVDTGLCLKLILGGSFSKLKNICTCQVAY